MELTSVRLAAPYVGLTLETYSAAIGAALLGISLGAALGGLAADRFDPRRFLGPMVIVGGALVLLVRPVALAVGPGLQGEGSVGSALLVGLATVPPVTVLAAVPPALVKLVLADLDRAGSVVGSLSALGTFGALAGTFLTGFVLLGTLGTRDILLVAGGLVIVAGLVTTVVLGRGVPPAPVLLLFGLGLLGSLTTGNGRCEEETKYFCARIVDDGEGVQLLLLDDLVHAAVDLEHPDELRLEYARRLRVALDAASEPGEALDVLHIGGGGFTLPRYLAAARPGSRSRVLELDPDILELNREQLGLRTGPALSVAIGDARTQIVEEPSRGYDAVVGDAFAARSVPWHLTTVELVREIHRVLRPGGVYAANLIDEDDLRFVSAEATTLREAFRHVWLLADPASVATGAVDNYILVASDRALAVPDVPFPPSIEDAEVLTDDRAPVDQLMSPLAIG